MHVNTLEAMYERSCVKIKVEPHSTFTFTCDTHTLPLLCYHKLKNYNTVKIHLKRFTLPLWEPTYLPPPHPPKCTRLKRKYPYWENVQSGARY